MKLWETRPMPPSERRWMTRVTAVAWAGVLAWNVSHVFDHLGQHRTDGWRQLALSFVPDILILIGVWKLRYSPKAIVGWLMTLVGLAWLCWAALSTSEPTISGRIIALAPIATVVLMTLALEFEQARAAEPEPERSEQESERESEQIPSVTPSASPKTRARTRAARPERPSATPSESPNGPTILPSDAPLTEPLAVLPATPKDPIRTESIRAEAMAVGPTVEPETTLISMKRPAPSRPAAAEILAALAGLDDVSAAELGRRHGGSDNFWIERKREESARRLDRELAEVVRVDAAQA